MLWSVNVPNNISVVLRKRAAEQEQRGIPSMTATLDHTMRLLTALFTASAMP